MGETKTSYNFIWITTILLVSILNWIEADPLVDTTLGKVRGTILTSDNGKPFYAFRGIPYAEPPVKHLRFMPPVPVDKWQNTLDATENGNACIQVDLFRSNLFTGDENCLYLNVYTKQLSKSILRPVMVFIHGGGFNCGEGSSDLYGPERLLDKDIVLVTFNYRLSALGFLSTEDAECPGNYGVLDQVEALKWIQKQIRDFGGDPNSVTIFGESAGSASVIFHLISPLSKGLFHGAIVQSGTGTDVWSLKSKPLTEAKALGVALNCPTGNSKNLVSCLRKRAALDVMIKSSMANFTNNMLLRYQPVIDKDFGSLTYLLSEHPITLLKTHQINKVPIMIGNVKDEGYTFFLMVSMKFGGPENFVIENLHSALAKLYENVNLDKIASRYFNNVDIADTHQRIRTFSNIISDLVMNADLDVIVKAIAASGVPTYAYQLTYSGENSYGSQMAPLLKEDYAKTLKLVCHIDDLQYLFRLGFFSNDLNLNDKQMAERMVTLWTNFAKKKVPSLDDSNVDNESVEWNPVQPNQQIQYLNIGEELRMEKKSFCTRPDLWEKYHKTKDEL